MKFLISVDIEGISGVTSWEHAAPGGTEWQRVRHLMTTDVNAAIAGLCQGGVNEIIVSDGHGQGLNLLIEELDPIARLNFNNCSPLSMVQGLEEEVDAAIFVGYHARAGTWKATLDHTWNLNVANLWLNGKLIGETGLNAALCSIYEVPVMMISGDQAVADEACELLPGIDCAIVKRATSRLSAECLGIKIAQQCIYETAVRAAQRFKNGDLPVPYKPNSPITIDIEFTATDMADRAQIIPGATRIDGRRLQFITPDILTAFRAFWSAADLSRE